MFEARHPRCQVTLQGVPVTGPYAALRVGKIDVLIHWLVADEPDLTPGPAIDRQDRVVAVAVSHPLASQETVSVEDLAGRPAARGLPARVVGGARAGEHSLRQARQPTTPAASTKSGRWRPAG